MASWGETVVSSNVVGYNKVTLAPGLNMLSAQFLKVGGEDSLTLLDAVNLTGQPSFDEDYEAQTTVRFYTGDGYDRYSWSGNLTGENPDMAAELEEELEIEDASILNNHWLNGDFEIVEEDVPVGSGFWLYAKNAGTITIAGEVPDGTNATIHISAGLNMVSCPWPMAISLANISMGNQPSFDEDYEAQTTLRIYTGDGYTRYNWSGNLTGENPDMAAELEEELEIEDASTLNNHWLNGDFEIVDDQIAIGTSFWIYAKNAGTITFSK